MLSKIVNRLNGDKTAMRRINRTKPKPVKRKSRIKKLAKGNASKAQFTACGDSLGAMLTANDRQPERVRLGSEWIHVSALVNGECLRAVGIAHEEEANYVSRPRAADRLLWAIGKAVEAYIRESLIKLFGRENALGRWSCTCGRHHYEGTGNDSLCSNCGQIASRYDEYHILNPETMLTGSPDIVLRRAPGAPWSVIEIKSIKVVPKGGVRNSTPEFHTIMKPVRGHSLQVLAYQKLMRMNGFDVTDEVLVIYGAKDYVMESPYKAFTLQADDEENTMAVDHLMGMAREYAAARKNKKVVARHNLCADANTPKAKGCHCKVSCFSRRS
jgi:hypothetical protein